MHFEMEFKIKIIEKTQKKTEIVSIVHIIRRIYWNSNNY